MPKTDQETFTLQKLQKTSVRKASKLCTFRELCSPKLSKHFETQFLQGTLAQTLEMQNLTAKASQST